MGHRHNGQQMKRQKTIRHPTRGSMGSTLGHMLEAFGMSWRTRGQGQPAFPVCGCWSDPRRMLDALQRALNAPLSTLHVRSPHEGVGKGQPASLHAEVGSSP